MVDFTPVAKKLGLETDNFSPMVGRRLRFKCRGFETSVTVRIVSLAAATCDGKLNPFVALFFESDADGYVGLTCYSGGRILAVRRNPEDVMGDDGKNEDFRVVEIL